MASAPVGRLVLGDDGSPSADLAWAWIVSHSWPGWQVEVATADPEATSAEPPVPVVWQPSRPRVVPGGGDLAVIHERLAGSPAAALAAYRDRDLLVVGPKGGGLRKALHLGSTAEALMDDPPLPMVIARHGQPTQRVLVATDGSSHCLAAARALVALPWVGDVAVSVAAVPEPGVDAERACSLAAAELGDGPASVRLDVLVPDGLQVAYSPRDMILDAVKLWDADLLVMGSRGLSGLASLRAGSISRWLAQHAPCSVLLAHDI